MPLYTRSEPRRQAHERALGDARCLDLIPRRAVTLGDVHGMRTGREAWQKMDEACAHGSTRDLVIGQEELLQAAWMGKELAESMRTHGRWFHLFVAARPEQIRDLSVEALRDLGVELVSIVVEPEEAVRNDLPGLVRQIRRMGILTVVTLLMDSGSCTEEDLAMGIDFLASLEADRVRMDFHGESRPQWSAAALEEDFRRNSSHVLRAARTTFQGLQSFASSAEHTHWPVRGKRLEKRVRRSSNALASLICSSERERQEVLALMRQIDKHIPPRPVHWMRRAVRATSALF